MSKFVETTLKVLQHGAESTVTLLDVILEYPLTLPRSIARLERGTRFKKDWAEIYRRRQVFYATLNRLKREGLVRKTKSGGETLWNITSQGNAHLAKVRFRDLRRKKAEKNSPPLPDKKKYSPRLIKDLIVVSFDVPEYARKRRHWLRTCLVSFGFKKLQNSVWVGKWSLPRDFIEDLKGLEMLPWVHVFAVTKRGTVNEVKVDGQ